MRICKMSSFQQTTEVFVRDHTATLPRRTLGTRPTHWEPMVYYTNERGSHSQVDEDVAVGSCWIKRLQFSDDFVLLATTQQVFSMYLIGFQLRAINDNTLQHTEVYGVTFTSDGQQQKELDTRIFNGNTVLREFSRSVSQYGSFQTSQIYLALNIVLCSDPRLWS